MRFSEHVVHQVHGVHEVHEALVVMSLISMKHQIRFFVDRCACSNEGTNKKKMSAPKS